MEILIVILLLILIGLVLIAIFKSSRQPFSEDRINSTMNEKFVGFQNIVNQTIEKARSEVERSKDVISGHAVKTLETINNMRSTLEGIRQQQKEAQELGSSLKYLLQTPKLRGSYGEEVLEEILARVLPKGVWDKQYTIEGSERVDAVIKYRDIVVPIDAKFPREIYERYLNAENEEEKKKNWKLYESGLKIQIDSIKAKYVKPEKGTSEFALMFIPSESIYYETIAEKNYLDQPCKIYEYARNNKVVPVSPNTFYAFLQIIIMGIRNLDILKNAKNLQEALIKIERDFKHFYAKYEDIGSALSKAQGAYKTGDTHIKRFKNSIESTIKLDLPNKPLTKSSK